MSRFKTIVYSTTKVVARTFAGSCFYLAGLVTTQLVSTISSSQIESRSHLEQILDQERSRAGIKEGTRIHVIMSTDREAISCAVKRAEGEYGIVLSPDGMNVCTLRHELYHIADGHCDAELGDSTVKYWLAYLFWAEPQATIYEATGLKP